MEIMTTRHPRVKLASFLAALSLAIPTVFCNAQEAEPAAPADDPVAREIVEKADLVRFPNEGFQVDVSITSSQPDQENELWKYRVLSKGNSNTVVMVTEPASERGQIMLMKGRDLWVFMPDVSQPIRISLSQRLTGQVANGDLARANFAGDYIPTLVGEETVDGRRAHLLELAARDRSVTYAKVRYWVAADDQHPLKAEFYSLSGKLLKTALYQDFREMAGRVRPTRLVIDDALKAGERSILTYQSMDLRDLPERMFTSEYLKRLQ